jgi:uncharacterized glyoxalase superfamily protein PhnB
VAQKKKPGKSAAKATQSGKKSKQTGARAVPAPAKSRPGKAAKPAKAAKPGKAAKPAKAAKPGKAAKPAKAAKPKRSKARPIPKGFTTVSAHLVVDGAAAAIAFYTKAFGARLKGRLDMPDGRIGHAELQLGDCRFMVADDFPEWAGGVSHAASKLPATAVTLHLYVKNVDKAFAQAVDAGCTVLMPLTDAFWGDRYGKLRDPFGHEWALATHLRDMTPKQMQKAMLAEMSAAACEPAVQPADAAPPADLVLPAGEPSGS